ncbi:glutamine synthetase [Marinobacterium nitratireducens]|uniref:Glutamine synthetase n=1 Tax=Marinobacterium nitratireducens TaxID=518897 RepID=A0A918DQG7_9GAMM|nr:glutamine synthetase family protein [Marinobacterium nitratireducens]GGO77304.1 glutamine synthetase [Marinobacterium nitratireducens]
MNIVEKFLQQHSIIEIECLVPDMTGNARGKFLPTRKFMAEQHVRLPEGILVQTVTGDWSDDYYELVDPADRDMVLAPDPTTLRLAPWAKEPTAQLIFDCHGSDGNPHPLSTRNVLRRVLQLYEDEGLQPVIAPEVEFYLVQKNLDPDYELKAPVGRSGRAEVARQSYSIDAVNEFDPLIDTLYRYCEAQQLDVDTLIHESGAGQMEINFKHGDPLALADQVFAFKRTLRETALVHDIYATFMAKPMEREPGSSMHVHQSLLDRKSGCNVFVGKRERFSEAFYHYLGGLQKYVPAAIAFFAPNVNSYRRFVPDIAAPINLQWGLDNRTTGLRVPDAEPAATRIENRFAGADANPYLAIALSLACGYLGMKEQLQPSSPATGSAYAANSRIEIARTLEEGLRLLAGCEPLQALLGERFVRAYIAVKLAEYEAFNKVISSWEREYLLLRV